MKETLHSEYSEDVLYSLSEIIKEYGPVTIECIYPPGTPVEEVSLAHSQEKTKSYILKINYGK